MEIFSHWDILYGRHTGQRCPTLSDLDLYHDMSGFVHEPEE